MNDSDSIEGQLENYPEVCRLLLSQKEFFNGISVPKLVSDYLSLYQAGSSPQIELQPISSGHPRDLLLSADDASKLWARSVAYRIYLDSENALPWKIADLSTEEKTILFSYDQTGKVAGADYFLVSNLPADPQVLHEYAIEHGLLGENIESTIFNSLDWARTRFVHMNSGDTIDPAKSIDEIVLSESPGGAIVYYGCPGAWEIFRDLLENLNIPVKKLYVRIGDEGPHISIHFPSIKRVTLHADNIVSYRRSSVNEVPVYEILRPVPVGYGSDDDTQTLENEHFYGLLERFLPDDQLLWRVQDLLNPDREKEDFHPLFADPISRIGGERGRNLLDSMDAKILEIGNGNLNSAKLVLQERVIRPMR